MMRSLLLLVVLSLPSLSFATQWEPTNPGGGGYWMRVNVGFDGRIIASSDLAGAYMSVDDGTTWTNLGSTVGVLNTHSSGSAFHPTDPNTFFLLSEHGVFKTTNGGASFSRPLSTGYVERAVVNPLDTQEVFLVRHSSYNTKDVHIYRSTDGGDSFSAWGTGLPPDRRGLRIWAATDNPQTLYLLTGKSRFISSGIRALFQSTDGGATWTEIGTQFNDSIHDFAIDPFDPTTIWVSADDGPGGQTFGHLYKSTLPHTTFTQVNQQSGVIWFDPTTPGRIRMFESRYSYPWDDREGIYESLDNGVSFTKISTVDDWQRGWSQEHWVFNSGSRALGQHPTDPNRMYWANSQFIHGTHDGTTVTPFVTDEVSPGEWRSRGIDNVVVVNVHASPTEPNTVWAGFHDLGLWRTSNGGATWVNCNIDEYTGAWDGSGGNTWTVITDPDRPGVVWAPMSASAYSNATLVRSDDAGAACDQWTEVGLTLPSGQIYDLALDPTSSSSNRTLYLSLEGDVYQSTDDGFTWSLHHADGELFYLAVDHFDGTVYAAGGPGLWRSPIGGGAGAWTEVGLTEMQGDSGSPGNSWLGPWDVYADPHAAGRVYVSVRDPNDGGLYRSSDHGGSWEPRLLTDDFLRSAVVHPQFPDVIYATSSRAFRDGHYNVGSNGVWRSTDGGSTWLQENAGMQWTQGLDLDLDPFAPHVAWVANPGQGIMRREFTSVTATPSVGASSLSLRAAGVIQGPTTIEFDLPSSAPADLAVYNVAGRRVSQVLSGHLNAGPHQRSWQPRDQRGRPLAAGVYFLRLVAADQATSRKIVVLK